NEGYQVTAVTDFTNVSTQVSEHSPNLILLDLNLPERDGLSLCADIRKVSQTPVIFVTSRDSAADELHALSLGGDDYITKPYNIPVLLARIKAVLRRSSGTAEPDTLTVGNITLHLARGTVSAGEKSVELTRNELKILSHLMTHAGKIVPRADLIEMLWESQIYIDDNTLSGILKTAVLQRGTDTLLTLLSCGRSQSNHFVAGNSAVYIDFDIYSVTF
ncbi:MAG: response regulator transcription factor, partial [Clostridia bacterium]|nr:response regulator transcription factor [Clostridia bacterium]